MAPVYASDPALPQRPQDSVPACPLRLWPGKTLTHESSSASPNALRQVQQIGQGKRARLSSAQGDIPLFDLASGRAPRAASVKDAAAPAAAPAEPARSVPRFREGRLLTERARC